jgi:hypothetical protein
MALPRMARPPSPTGLLSPVLAEHHRGRRPDAADAVHPAGGRRLFEVTEARHESAAKPARITGKTKALLPPPPPPTALMNAILSLPGEPGCQASVFSSAPL